MIWIIIAIVVIVLIILAVRQVFKAHGEEMKDYDDKRSYPHMYD